LIHRRRGTRRGRSGSTWPYENHAYLWKVTFLNLEFIKKTHKLPLVLHFKIIKMNVVGGDSGVFGGNTIVLGEITETYLYILKNNNLIVLIFFERHINEWEMGKKTFQFPIFHISKIRYRLIKKWKDYVIGDQNIRQL